MKKLYFLLFTILISAASFGQELMLNGGFESWDDPNTPTSFEKAENTDQESTEIHSGTYSAKHTGGTSDIAQTITGITPGTSYTVSLWYKVDPGFGDGTDARIWSYWRTGTTTLSDNAAELRGPNNSYFDNNGNIWTQYSVTVTAPATADNFYFEVRTYGTAVVYWDDFSFFQEAPSTDPTLALSDGPANGDTLIGDPETATNPTIDFATTNFTMSNDAGGGVSDGSGDGFIKWTAENTNGNVLVDSGSVFTSNDTNTTYPITGLSTGETYFFRAELVDNNGDPLSTPVVYSFTITIAAYTDVPDLATLRAQTVDPDLYYRVTGEVINTYSRTNRNQKYFQDATGGILVDDVDGLISTVYSEGDGATNIRGHLSLYFGLLQFVPTDADWGKSSTGNVVTPEVVTIATVATSLDTYESKLVRINNVTFTDGDGVATFASSQNYAINDGTGSTFRTTFYEADYIGELIPSGATDMNVIVGNYNGGEQFTARSLAELTLATKKNAIQGFAMYPNPTSLGYVNITSKANTKMNVSVYDILGKQVIKQTVSNNLLNVSGLKTGLYIMKVEQDDAVSTRKLVIQ